MLCLLTALLLAFQTMLKEATYLGSTEEIPWVLAEEGKALNILH